MTDYGKTYAVQCIGDMKFSKTFKSTDTFGAIRKAEEWLTAHGYSFGRMCSPMPTGIAFGTVDISKWSNLGEDVARLDGAIVGDMREGPVTVLLRKTDCEG